MRDTGIDLDHPDLAARIDGATGYNCVDPALPPDAGTFVPAAFPGADQRRTVA